MQLNELGDRLQDAFDYPVDSETVREEMGQETIDSEDAAGGRTIASILDNHPDEEFASANELHQTLIGELPDEYIGRKFYDDRGSNPGQNREGHKEDEAESL